MTMIKRMMRTATMQWWSSLSWIQSSHSPFPRSLTPGVGEPCMAFLYHNVANNYICHFAYISQQVNQPDSVVMCIVIGPTHPRGHSYQPLFTKAHSLNWEMNKWYHYDYMVWYKCDDIGGGGDEKGPGMARSIPGTPVLSLVCKLKGPYGGYLKRNRCTWTMTWCWWRRKICPQKGMQAPFERFYYWKGSNKS